MTSPFCGCKHLTLHKALARRVAACQLRRSQHGCDRTFCLIGRNCDQPCLGDQHCLAEE
ncbi:hypothetical protein IQ272_24960 [Chroococcidiopsidales cyanobacterium LEGE 13417]|uniref:hypothetical protein n=1 Tax=Chroococcidiopsis sp. CCALA 051 TaxID=869949 RepID=UPI001304CC7E|nr:hypothetical protein [Chroococcidiopsis sp. CCALA 051]MBE9019324.1 hypothetical protein [Chroococcidiopsidales cyanobacterium LEGE 13417]